MSSPDFNYDETVTVLSVDGNYSNDWMPKNLGAAIIWLQGIWNDIPIEHRNSATIEIESFMEYDSTTETLAVIYKRPATEEEIEKRKEDHLMYQKSQVEWAQRMLKNDMKSLEV